jgi:hypothetical protein
MNRAIIWLSLTTISLIPYGGLVTLDWQTGTLREEQVPTTLAWYALAFAAYLGSLVWAERRQPVPLALIWLGAIAFRVMLLFTGPSLSDDVYRYLWDGYIFNHGVSPYAYPIESAELDHLDIPLRSMANHGWMASPYLPAAQLLFAGMTRLLPLQPIIFQSAMIIFDLLAAWLLVGLLRAAALPDHRLVLYLWNPLVVVELAHGAHVDGWMIFLTMLALWLTFSPKRPRLSSWLAPAALALATLTKLLPVLLLPVLFWHWRWRQLLLYGGLIIILLLPFGGQAGWGLTGPLDGTGLFGAVRIYADQWNFNSGLGHWLQVGYLPSLGVTQPFQTAKRLGLLALLAVLAVIWLQARRRTALRPTLRLMAVPFMAYLLLTPTVHPWYALTLLVFLPFLPPAADEPRRYWLAVAPWLCLSATLPLSYLTYLDPLDFRELEWVRQLEWLPALALLLVWMIYGRVHSLIVPP